RAIQSLVTTLLMIYLSGVGDRGSCDRRSPNGTLWNIEQVRRSVDFRARKLDHLGPLLCICGDECAELGGRAFKHRVAEEGDARLHLGIGEAGIDRLVELVDDLGGCIPGRADPLPASSLVARHEVAYGRDVW